MALTRVDATRGLARAWRRHGSMRDDALESRGRVDEAAASSVLAAKETRCAIMSSERARDGADLRRGGQVGVPCPRSAP